VRPTAGHCAFSPARHPARLGLEVVRKSTCFTVDHSTVKGGWSLLASEQDFEFGAPPIRLEAVGLGPVSSPNLVPLTLTDEERRALTAWPWRRKLRRHWPCGRGSWLAWAEGGTVNGVAAKLVVSGQGVEVAIAAPEGRLTGLTDEPRPGRPRTIGDEQAEAVITATLKQASTGRGQALVRPVDGQAAWPVPVCGLPDLEGLRAYAAPRGDVEAQIRCRLEVRYAGQSFYLR
jgi:hypothetical protein